MTTLSDYYRAVEKRFFSSSGSQTDISVRIAGRRLVFHFQTSKEADCRIPALRGLITTEDTTEPDGEFFYWVDDPSHYTPARDNAAKGVWMSSDETGSLLVVSGYRLIGADHKRRRYYHCLTAESDQYDRSGNHPMVVPLLRWALDSDMIVMHCAAVGVAGHGVLICGRGGQGKSTLAISCMMLGMDFVSDDYVLLNLSGRLLSMPIYRTVGINPDMEDLLKTGLPVLKKDRAFREKLLLDTSSVNYCEELMIDAIIFPVLGDEVGIIPTSPGKALTQLVHSSISQLYVYRDARINRIMLQRLQGLPVYEMTLGRDLHENAVFLREFLQGREQDLNDKKREGKNQCM